LGGGRKHNINVFEKTKENYLRSSEYVEAKVNVLDEVPHSYSHQRNLELVQTRYTIETKDHEYVDSEVARLFSRIYAFCEEEGHAIMDCPFVPFHIKADNTKHVELQNVAITLVDQPWE
jgi:hypothetical protein